MKDEWSIKDKAFYVWRWMEGGIEPEIGLQVIMDEELLHEECVIYDKPTINKLREKLIEDIKPYEKWIPVDDNTMILTKIINKRFGVKE